MLQERLQHSSLIGICLQLVQLLCPVPENLLKLFTTSWQGTKIYLLGTYSLSLHMIVIAHYSPSLKQSSITNMSTSMRQEQMEHLKLFLSPTITSSRPSVSRRRNALSFVKLEPILTYSLLIIRSV